MLICLTYDTTLRAFKQVRTMKWILPFICLLPFVVTIDTEADQLGLQLIEAIKNIKPNNVVQNLAKFMAIIDKFDHVDTNLKEGTPKNAVYDLITSLIRGILPKIGDIVVPSIGSETGNIYVENAVISGISKTTFVISSGKGYDVSNISLILPELTVTADKYYIKHVDLGIIVLTGKGKFKATIDQFYFQSNFTAKLGPKISIDVLAVPGFWLGLQGAQFELENLGGEGEAISRLLNGIATDVAPVLINSLSNDLNAIWNTDPTFSTKFADIFENVLNFMLCVARKGDIEVCLEPVQ